MHAAATRRALRDRRRPRRLYAGLCRRSCRLWRPAGLGRPPCASWAIARTCLRCCRRSISSSGCRGAKACRMSSPKPARPACRSSPRRTMARCSRSTMACRACSCRTRPRRGRSGHAAPARRSAALRDRLGSALRRKVETHLQRCRRHAAMGALFDDVVAERQPAPPPSVFQSFLQGGFECSTHRLRPTARAARYHRSPASTTAMRQADYRQLAGHRHPHRARWASLAPDRNRRRAHTTGRASCRCCAAAQARRHAGDLGSVPLRLAR